MVYLAEQTEPVRRTVALKIIKPGMDTKQVIARFEAERQALALMDHPNIARILDAGSTDSGRPYFVMELVKGIPITEYCDQCNLTTSERLNLYTSVCQAVQHAHQKGIIHRDIKPTNVLVTVSDGEPVAKMIDFGVAKAINQRLTEQTLRTGFSQMIGTPMYMSPEQAEMSPLDVDTRTDIYSLGVLLYELLAGMTPFDKERLSTATFDELRRIIREEEPPRPSARLSTASIEQADTVAAHRRTEAHRLAQMLRGDLDWIVVMAMEKDRTRRYESASALARDIECYKRSEPVQACPPSSWYRFRRFARRRKGALAAAVLVLALAIAGPIVALNQTVLYATAQGLRQQAQNDADQYRRLLYVADMNVALHDWNAGNIDRVLELLKRHIPNARDTDLRGFEWYHLWHLCQKAAGVPRITTDNAVWSLDISPDGKSMVTGHYDGVAMWDMVTRKKRFSLPIKVNVVHTVSFAPDGRSFATMGPSNTIQLWDAQTGASGQRLEGHEGWVFSLAFSHDGTKLASASWDQTVKLWDLTTGDCLATLEGHETEVFCVAFSPDGALVASGGWDGIVRVWNVAKEEQIAELAGHEDMIVAVAFSPDGRRIASCSRDKSVRVWNVADGRQRLVLQHARSWIGSVAFSSDGRTIAGGDGANAIHLWDAAAGQLIDTLKGHGSAVTAVRFHAQDSVLISAGWDHTVRFWDVSNARAPTVLIPKPKADSPRGHRDLISIDVSADQATVAAGGVDGRVHIWEIDSGKQRAVWQAHDNWVTDVAFHPTENLLASASWDGTINLWNPADPAKPLVTLADHTSKVQAVEFSPDGKLLASAGEDSTVRLWNVETWASAGVFKGHSGWVNDVVFSTTGRLASSDSDSTVRIWSLDTQRLLDTIRISSDSRWLTGIDFSRDGDTLSTADWQGTVCLWNVDDGRQQLRFRGHASSVEDAAFSPTEEILATCGIDFSIKLWDVRTGELRGTLIGHTDDVNALVFKADGRILMSASDDGTIRVWRTAARE